MSWFKKLVSPPKDEPHYAELPGSELDASIDVASPTWRFIAKWSKDNLIAARENNDSMRRGEVDTAFIRGQISIYKSLAELHKEPAEKSPGILGRRNAGL